MVGTTGNNYELILHDEFDSFNRYDDNTGVWATDGRRGTLVTNGPRSVFLDGTQKNADGEAVGINPISLQDGYLNIGAGVIPEETLPIVKDIIWETGQGKQFADKTEYYTGRISTSDTWSQTYGYFEIVAQVPEGRGHWSAFWLSPAGDTWPPEIDIFEAYGRGVHQRTPKDDTFNTAVFFDEYDTKGNKTQSIDITNQYDLDANGNPTEPDLRSIKGDDLAVFHKVVDAGDYGWDIYDNFFTYAAEWTPDEIIFYFGPDRDSLVEVFRTPTPDDLHSPMIVIANDQISSRWGWQPVDGYDHLTFAEDNGLKIDSISLYALTPDALVPSEGSGRLIVGDDKASVIEGTSSHDVIRPGDGLDFIHLNGGADTVIIERGTESNVIEGFGVDDHVVLDGFYFDGVEDALGRLTQVGNDVWLTSGAYPLLPQTVIFRDTEVADITADNLTVRWSETPNVWSNLQLDGKRRGDGDGDGIVVADPSGSKLVGGNGKTLIGSTAGDLYFSYGDRMNIVEQAQGGVDTAYAYTHYALPDHVENIHAENGWVTITGNDLGNILKATGANTLIGGRGDDLYDVRQGNNATIVVTPGDGHDHILGFGAGDTIDLGEQAFTDVAAFLAALSVEGKDTLLQLEGGSLTFRNTDASKVAESFGFELPDDFGVPSPSPGTDASRSVQGTNSDEVIWGTLADDVLKGANGDDVIVANAGDDRVNGGMGDDTLTGSEGQDALTGSHGNDVLIGGSGRDMLSGGEGSDTFVFDVADGAGRDVINNFDHLDTIMLDGLQVEAIEQSGRNHVLIDLDNGADIIVRNTSVADLNMDMFVFV